MDARRTTCCASIARIDGPVDVRVPWRLQRRYNLAPWIVLERDDQTMRYKAVAFRDPEEVMLLPESIESLTVVRERPAVDPPHRDIQRLPPLSDRRPGRQEALTAGRAYLNSSGATVFK